MKKGLLITLLVTGIVAVVSCRKEEPEAPPEAPVPPGSVVLRSNAVWIDGPTGQTLTSVDSNQVVFNGSTTQLTGLSVGSIIVSGIIENAPVGFCRRITQIDQSGTLYTLTTEEVSLTEVFEELHIEHVRTFGLDDTARSGPVFTINLPNVVLFDADGNSATTVDQVRVNGSVDVSPSLTVDVDITQGQLQYAKIGGQVECELTNTISLGGSIGLFSGELNIYEQPLAPFNIPGTPVVIVPVLVVKVGAEGDVQVEVTAGYSSSTNASAYLEYTGGAWQTIFDRSMSNTHSLSDINGQVSATAYVGPSMDFRLWGSNRLRGYVDVAAYLNATASLVPTPGCEIKAGIRGGVGANLRLFRVDLLNVGYPDLFDLSTVLYQCGGQQPVPPVANFSGTPTAVALGAPVNFNDLSSGSPTSWQWSFPGGTPSSSTAQSPTVVYNSPGQYDVTLNVSNASGSNSLTRPAYITVTAGGSAPVADFVASQTAVAVGQAINFTDVSSGGPTSWEWTFNGANVTSSTVQNPSGVVYSAPGTYSVSLSVSNAQGSDVETKVDYITVTGASAGCGGLTSIVDIDGNVYTVVEIGNQCWMADNLRTIHYANGEEIPNVTSGTVWVGLTSGAWSWYNNNSGYDDTHGKLYNWYVISDPRNVCPFGWHVPSDQEWMILEQDLGVSESELNINGGRGILENVGGRMKEVILWNPPNTGANNESGFSGIAGGGRGGLLNGPFNLFGSWGSWWTSTEVPNSYAQYRSLRHNEAAIHRNIEYMNSGLSIRCIRD
ncbi:MAG: PKD domain-containing protein [Flavobacteriales bacterium]|nr:PKD domain-containing protein [Flavobacteriales bacterium]